MSDDLALRYNTGKPQLSFILDFGPALEEVAKVAEFGAEKYELNNWQKGQMVRKILDSALRHLVAYSAGEDRDAESKQLHVAHAAWNLLALLYQNDRIDLDNRRNEPPF